MTPERLFGTGGDVGYKCQFVRFGVTVEVVKLRRDFFLPAEHSGRLHLEPRIHVGKPDDYRFVLLGRSPVVFHRHLQRLLTGLCQGCRIACSQGKQ